MTMNLGQFSGFFFIHKLKAMPSQGGAGDTFIQGAAGQPS